MLKRWISLALLLPLLHILISGSDALPRPQNLDDYEPSVDCGGTNGAPLITPCLESVQLDYKTSYTLRCEAEEPVTWWYAHDSVLTEEFDNSETDPQRPYGAGLELVDVTAEKVGAYYCIKKSQLESSLDIDEDKMVEYTNNYEAVSIYVYVNDPNHLLVPYSPLVMARQYTSVVIPCKPTMPDTEVILQFNSETTSSKKAIRYNPMKGFSIEMNGILQGGEYECLPAEPSPDNDEEINFITVKFIASRWDNPSTKAPTSTLGYDYVDEDDDEVPTTVTNQSKQGKVALISGDGFDGVTSDFEAISWDRAKRSPASSSSPRPGQVNKPMGRPEIKSSINHHVEKDSSFTLVCEQTDVIDASYHMEWITPIKDMSRLIITTPKFVKTTNTTHQVGRGTLTVEKAQLTDSGPYKCVVSDGFDTIYSTYKLRVLKMNETYLRVYEPTNHYSVEGYSNKTIQMTANFEGYPIPTFYWHKPDGSDIHQTEPKFKIISRESSTTLQILNAQLEDSGTYVLRGENIYNTVNRQYNVSVKSGPVVSVSDVYVQVGGEAKLECYVRGHPLPIVSLNFYSCSLQPRWPNCEYARENIDLTSKMRPGRLSVETIYEAIFTPTKPGIFSCAAMNLVDGQNFSAIARAHVMLGDIPSNMTIHGLDLNRKIARGDEENFTCEALAYHFNGDLKWYHDGEELVESDDVKIIRTVSQYSHKSTVHFSAIGDRDRGTYECRAHHIHRPSEYDRREVDVYIHEPKAPVWQTPNIPKKLKIERKLSQSLELECRSTAVPLATVRWFKDDKELVETNLTHILEDESKLFISHLYPRDDGVYTCQVENRLGKIEKSVTVIITDLPGINKGWVWFGIIMFLFLVSLCAFLAVRYHKEHKRHLALKAAGLANFEEGAVAHINPDLTLDEQAELLPYNREFEFPRDSLKLGKQLGAGAFGVVLKGEATGIRKEERCTTVAVKMVKRTADDEVVRALVSELKIMVHLGQHLNVVNLLGAVTKNIAKRELMVIVEYCRFGNIQNFLLRNRKCFINQINSETDHIDPSITIQRESENFDLHRDANGGGGLKYANIGFPHHSYINHMNSVYNNNTHSSPHRRNSDNDPRSGTRAGRTVTGNATYSYDRQMDTCATVMTTVPEDDQVMSNNSVQPAWRSNYKTDVTEAMPVTTVDLISWAFQVARGMDYLSSKKVLHGDLAARNILLCEDNVVKICDFGLARSMYRGDNYKKSESGKLPIKWLALESLCDHVFSTYSDVWSFGIVLWEMFSLAKVPYPGIDPNQELFNKLNDGYRMEKPPYANQELYEIMLECWRKNPESRPLFNALEKRFANMLGEDVANHYLDLNNPYMQSNLEYMKKQETDYLALMGSPDEVAPSAPSYVNGRIVPDIRIESVPDDYQAMSPDQDSDSDACTAIFSQSRPEDGSSDFPDFSSETTFNFPAGSRQSPTLSNNMNNGASKLLRKKNGIPTVDAADQAPEEIPMLHRQSGGSDDGPDPTRRFNQTLKQHYATPTPTPSPRHHVETKLNGEFSGSAAENYVNVKPPRKNIPGKSPVAGASTDAFSNPGYQPLSSASEKEQRRY
ncbi:uncharacterized protein Dana_GF15270, isoform B [Drosophila ananassae]|uniref:Uncharacterized protein, isoform B n=1 Tax=Drosophila ananassae TaxID=7217 RepID=A0A0N8NZ45_DROAN|nr:vascular endothelial growth factor receptor 1 isoform X2 [Drosophila ananassae]KPU73300.1 uncharacterized protein Dana_GF15270, isoform B [Drosophila ananassae]